MLANWRPWNRAAGASTGVFVFDGSGLHVRTVTLEFAGLATRFAPGPDGNLWVIGVESHWLQDQTRECYLLHKFSPEGKRLASLSNCPETEQPGPGGRPLSSFSPLREETARGHLFVHEGLIHHVLPVSRRLRIFRTDGALVRDVALIPPPSSELLAPCGLKADQASQRIWRIVPLPEGRFLVEWLHAEKAGTAGERRTTFLAVHGADGSPITAAADPP
ncbi:MAG: hypothetical protein ACP5U2_15905, partial [Bryobacteraceae bacterium]